LTTWLGFNTNEPILEWLVYSPGPLFGALVLIPIARRASISNWQPIVFVVLSSILYFAAAFAVAESVTGSIGPRLVGPLVSVAAVVSAATHGVLLASVAWLAHWRAKAMWVGATILSGAVGGALIGKGFTELSGTGFNPQIGLAALVWIFAGFAVAQLATAGILQLGIKDRRVTASHGAA
jgi:hypothetical protein